MTRYYFVFNTLLLTVGLGISLYLYSFYSSRLPIPCSIAQGCDIVRSSPYSSIFGVPVPLYGVFFYSFTLLASFAAFYFRRFRFVILVWLCTTFGFLFAVYLTSLEAFVIHAYCSWCLLNAFINIVTFAICTYVTWVTAKKYSLAGILSL